MGTSFAPLVADLFLFCHERDIRHHEVSHKGMKSMKSLTKEKRYDMIDDFNSTSR